jgi:hypothetical protein
LAGPRASANVDIVGVAQHQLAEASATIAVLQRTL